MPGGLNILDIGCGDPHKEGSYMDGLWTLAGNYIGVDPSLPRIRGIRCSDSLGLATGVGERLPIKNDSMDMVLIMSALAHCASPEVVLREAWRVLRPQGMVCLFVNNRRSWFKRLFSRKAARLQREYSSLQPNFFTRDSLLRLMKSAGFVQDEVKSFYYLRCPNSFGDLLAKIMGTRARHICYFADRVGEMVLPDGGGRLLVWARKN